MQNTVCSYIRRELVFLVAAFVLLTVSVLAQPSPQVLHNHVRPAVSSGQAALVGSLPATQKMRLTIVLPLRNQAALTSLLSRLYDPQSPDYRKFLSVSQFTEEFGPTVEDYQTAVNFAQANGFTVTDRPVNRLIVPINGTVAQVEKAFHVRMNVYQHPTEQRTFFSPDREPSLDLNVAVAHIAGLNNYSIPRPMVETNNANQSIANVTGSGPGGSYLGSDMRAAYYGGATLTGNGQAVGILEFAGYRLSDVNETFSNAGQSYNVPINNVLLNGATIEAGSDDSEEVLDIVQAIGMAPGLSQVRVYIGNSGQDADIFNAMATDNIAKQLSVSWGWEPQDVTSDDGIFEELAAQGQSLFVASGDDGAFDTAISPYFFPTEDAYVTAVGATHLTTNGAAGLWVSESAWNSYGHGSGGGISPDNVSIPSWQAGVANSSNGGSTTFRNLPDVAMEGDYDNYYCSMGACADGAAGTSFAAPRWAGFMALINQQAVEAGSAPNGGIGFINPAIYSIGLGSSYGSEMHDAIGGNNDTDGQPAWYSAVTGYDLVTGWGSPNGQYLIDALAGPAVPGFWLSASMPTLSIEQVSSGTNTITLTDAGGFSSSVNLAASGLPNGVTASFSPSIITGSSELTLTASSTATVGTATITVTGISGSLSTSTTFVLTVSPQLLPAPPIGQFGSVNVGTTSSATPLTVTIQGAGILGSIAVLTQGAANQDFALASGGTCVVGRTYGTNATCTVNVTFTPKFAGVRSGAVVLSNASGSVLANSYLQGIGQGPQISILPGSQTAIGSGYTSPKGVAVDGSGDLFIADAGNESSGGSTASALYEEKLSNGVYTQTAISCASGTPAGVAIDGAGNLYYTVPSVPAVYKVTLANGQCVQTSIGNGFGTPLGVAVDGSGNVYIADYGISGVSTAVYEENLQPNGSYVQTTIGSTWVAPSGVAVDGNGNVYVADAAMPGVYKETLSGSGYTQSTVGSGWVSPVGIAVDASGDVYVADAGNSYLDSGIEPAAVYQELLSSGSYIQTQIGSGWTVPNGLAVDGSGNVYIADQVGGVYKEDIADPFGVTFANTTADSISSDSPYIVTIANIGNTALNFSAVSYSYDFPEAIGYPSDCTSSTALTAGGTCTLSIEFFPTAALGTNSSLMVNESVTVITNNLNSTAASQVFPVEGTELEPAATVQLTASMDPGTVGSLVTFTATMSGEGVTPTGTVTFYNGATALGSPVTLTNGTASYSTSSLLIGSYVISAVYSGDYNYTGSTSNSIAENIVAAPAIANFGDTSIGNESIGATSASIPLTIKFIASETLGSISVLTQGATNQEFTNAGGGTCLIGTAYAVNATCIVNVAFNPQYAGTRYGAVVLADGNGNILGIGYLQGTGVGPQMVFLPGTLGIQVSGIGSPQGVAVDGSGNIYITDAVNGVVYQVFSLNGTLGFTTIGSGFSQPYGVAVDGSGNIYVTDKGNQTVYKETLVNGSYVQTTIGYGFIAPMGVAVDGSGNLYVADFGNGSTPGSVYMETLSNGSYEQTALAGQFVSPQGAAVDGNGNVYVADPANGNGTGAVYELALVSGSYTQSAIGNGWITPTGIAIDGVGNLYIADEDYGLGSGFVNKEALQSNGSYIQSTLLGNSNVFYPDSLAVDKRGNLYVNDVYEGYTYLLDIADPPSLTFSTTPVGSTSSDSPQTVTVENAGNAAMTFPVPSTGTNASLSTNFTLGSLTTCPRIGATDTAATLNAGNVCTYSVDFTPAVIGSITGTLVLTDNSLSASTTSQTIALNGTATIGSQAIIFSTIPAQTVGTPLTLSATASSGLAVSFASTTPTICTVSGTTATFLAAGSCSITASQPGNSTYAAATPVTQSFTVKAALQAQTITFPTIPAQTVGTPLTLSATASSGLAVSFASTTPTICTVSGTTATFLAAGSCSITASQAGNSTYAAATPVTQSFTVNAAASKISLQLASTQLVYPGATDVTVCVASATSAPATGSVKIYDGTTLLTTLVLGNNGCVTWYISPGLSAGTHVITAVYSGDSNNPSGTSAATSLMVSQVPVSMNASCWSASFAYGGNYECTVSISSSGGTPQGSITYSLDGSAVVKVPLSTGNAQFTISKPTAGNHQVVIAFAQQTNYAAAATQTESFTVTPAPVNVALTPSSWYASAGTDVSFTVAITSWSAGPPDTTGTVSFYNGTTLLATVPVNASGQATYSTAGLSVGTHSITTTYAGSANYASGSDTVTITIHAGS